MTDMSNIRNATTLLLMPEVFRQDPKVQAASYALRDTIRLLLPIIDKTSVYAVTDSLSDPLLDLLALELRAQYYDASMPEEEKRQGVKKALPWHYRAGTLAAVKELTSLTWKSDSAQVREWFQYQSKPYLFKILLGTDVAIHERTIDSFLTALWKVKNTRSHLEAITFKRRLEHKLHIGCAPRRLGRQVIIDTWHGCYKTQGNTYIGSMPSHCTRIIIKEE